MAMAIFGSHQSVVDEGGGTFTVESVFALTDNTYPSLTAIWQTTNLDTAATIRLHLSQAIHNAASAVGVSVGSNDILIPEHIRGLLL